VAKGHEHVVKPAVHARGLPQEHELEKAWVVGRGKNFVEAPTIEEPHEGLECVPPFGWGETGELLAGLRSHVRRGRRLRPSAVGGRKRPPGPVASFAPVRVEVRHGCPEVLTLALDEAPHMLRHRALDQP
jgi:hypothetical protein